VTPFYPEPIIPVPHDTAPMCSEAARLGRPLNPGDPTKQIVRDKQHELHARLAALKLVLDLFDLVCYTWGVIELHPLPPQRIQRNLAQVR